MQVLVLVECARLLGTADKTDTDPGLEPKIHDNLSTVHQIHSDQFVPTVPGSVKHLQRNDPRGNLVGMIEFHV